MVTEPAQTASLHHSPGIRVPSGVSAEGFSDRDWN
jgi:hypothetical protein